MGYKLIIKSYVVSILPADNLKSLVNLDTRSRCRSTPL
jgi:hypothetical protein